MRESNKPRKTSGANKKSLTGRNKPTGKKNTGYASGKKTSRSEGTARLIDKRFKEAGRMPDEMMPASKRRDEKLLKNEGEEKERIRPSAKTLQPALANKLRKPDFRTGLTPESGKVAEKAGSKKDSDGLIRLNRYIAQAGVCSRREADNLIQAGAVKVNGIIISELGSKVKATDKVQVGDDTLTSEKLRYVLLNKPKGYITTTDDPEKRNTVMQLVDRACRERIYPVGRLDRNTTGLLLFTNDGEVTRKLSHPSGNIKKIYHVSTDQPVSHAHLESISEGINLEDGIVKPDAIDYVGDGADRKQIGIELHSGKNRIVRRIFESLGYKVVRLDRVYFAGFTKKDLPRGHWRFLTHEEVNFLKMN